jgi:hypothetical protein
VLKERSAFKSVNLAQVLINIPVKDSSTAPTFPCLPNSLMRNLLLFAENEELLLKKLFDSNEICASS